MTAQKGVTAAKSGKSAAKSAKPTKPRATRSANSVTNPNNLTHTNNEISERDSVIAKALAQYEESLLTVGEEKKAGRPTLYSKELCDAICELIAIGLTLRQIDRLESFPSKTTMCSWLVKYDDFRTSYTRAMEIRALVQLDEIQEIADDGTNDYVEIETRHGSKIILDSEHVQRSRLRVDTRIKMLEKLQPRKYGAKLDLNHDTPKDSPFAMLMSQIAGKVIKPVQGDGESGE